MDFDAVKRLDRKYHMPTYNRFNVAIVSGKGSIAVDVAGREYVDFSSGISGKLSGVCGCRMGRCHIKAGFYSSAYIKPLLQPSSGSACGKAL